MPASDKHAKTEAPTPKRRKEARDNGQVARSPDVASWGALLVGTMIIPTIFSSARSAVLGVVGQAANVMSNPSTGGATAVLYDGLHAAFFVILPISSTFMVLAVATNIAQVGRVFSLKAARPRFDKINPVAGFKRLFSPQSAIGLAKQVAKLTVLGGLAYSTIHSLMIAVPATVPVGITQAIGLGANSILGFVRDVAGLGLAIGLGDYAYQRHHVMKMLKMTKQEVKDEHRAQEGDPAVKGEIRRRGYLIARGKLIAAVRTADVIIANPTHFSVALQYSAEGGGAPTVVSKGADDLARRIREEASTCGIPVVEDPPLARYLFATCDIGTPIPVEIYLAVARLLAFVYSLPHYVRSNATLHPIPSVVPFDPGEEAATQGRMNSRRRAKAGQAA